MSEVKETENSIKIKSLELTPKQIVAELDRYIISQKDAKKAVAIALRNRWRRMQVEGDIREEITPKNIIMLGPTGVGKTEISRRLAKLANAPFVKVEASKFTEVGYVGRDVESIIRDLAEVSFRLVKEEEKNRIKIKAEEKTEERILDILLPNANKTEEHGEVSESVNTREKLRTLLREGKLEDRIIEFEVSKQVHTHMEIIGPPGFGEVEGQIKDLFSNMVPKAKEKQKLKISEARDLIRNEIQEELLDKDEVSRLSVKRAEQTGIVFIDEIDKVCGRDSGSRGPDVSREGVQRDLLPLVEGTSVSTKYGSIKTDHILFIASGAFHVSKPSDLMPEFQGRFPIRVELKSLEVDDFVRILKEPQNALTKQYQALMRTEGLEIDFTEDAILELANYTAKVNSRNENIGARRLHTVLEKLLEELSYEADEKSGVQVVIDREYVVSKLDIVVNDKDMSEYIL